MNGPSGYFDSLASQWSRKYDRRGALRQRINRFVEPVRERLPPGSKVLDFGCGSGDITVSLKHAGFDVSGYDISPGMLEAARRRCSGEQIEFVLGGQSPWSRVPVENSTFAGVVASSVLEYSLDPVGQVAELSRVLDQGGLLVMTVPDPSHPIRKLERVLRLITKSPLKWTFPLFPERGRAYWGRISISVNHFPLHEWEAILQRAGMRVDQVSADGSPLARIMAIKVAESGIEAGATSAELV